MLKVLSGQRTERIPSVDFEKNPEVEEGWEVIARKDGYVYIGFNRELAKKQQAEREAQVLAVAKQMR